MNDRRSTGPTISLESFRGTGRSVDTCVWQEHIYKDMHANPELSFQETKTAALVASVCVKRRTARHYFT